MDFDHISSLFCEHLESVMGMAEFVAVFTDYIHQGSFVWGERSILNLSTVVTNILSILFMYFPDGSISFLRFLKN